MIKPPQYHDTNLRDWCNRLKEPVYSAYRAKYMPKMYRPDELKKILQWQDEFLGDNALVPHTTNEPPRRKGGYAQIAIIGKHKVLLDGRRRANEAIRANEPYPVLELTRPPIIISFFTPDGDYPINALNLRNECEQYGFEYHIERRENQGGYFKNTCMKPKFILECLERFKRPVFWVDVDNIFNTAPDLTFDDCDIGVVETAPEKNKYKYYVAALYFGYTAKAKNFLKKWASLCTRTDHSAFSDLAEKMENDLTILPNSLIRTFSNKGQMRLVNSRWQGKRDDYKKYREGGGRG